jgi:hypothetical protein
MQGGKHHWGIRTDIADYGLPSAVACDHDVSMWLAAVPTRLAKMSAELQERMINWGYAVSDAALRRNDDETIPCPQGSIPTERIRLGARGYRASSRLASHRSKAADLSSEADPSPSRV